jgi:hypothetical protein
MTTIAIGVHVRAEPDSLVATVTALGERFMVKHSFAARAVNRKLVNAKQAGFISGPLITF